MAFIIHTVGPGNTLRSIADRYSVPAAEIARASDGRTVYWAGRTRVFSASNPNLIWPGLQLVIPRPAPAPTPAPDLEPKPEDVAPVVVTPGAVEESSEGGGALVALLFVGFGFGGILLARRLSQSQPKRKRK